MKLIKIEERQPYYVIFKYYNNLNQIIIKIILLDKLHLNDVV